jgi:predicted component of type VI protein secretion system
MSAGPAPVNSVAQLLRPGSRPRAVAVDAEDREQAVAVVAHLLHAECEQWSWTVHRADAHRGDALRIVGALCREGWAPASAA